MIAWDAAGARGDVRDVEALLAAARRWAEARRVEVQLLDARLVFGRDHLRSAVEHAARAHANGTNAADTLAGEVVRYAAAERQVRTALEKVGLRNGTTAVVALVLGGVGAEDLVSALGLKRDDSLLEGGAADPDRFGLTQAERRTVGDNRLLDLVLERVALVDIEK